MRRLMEAENAKLRKGARREYNEAVRELATFLQRRDKRVKAHQARCPPTAAHAAAKLSCNPYDLSRAEHTRHETLRC